MTDAEAGRVIADLMGAGAIGGVRPSAPWGPIDALRLVGSGVVLPLDVARREFTLDAGPARGGVGIVRVAHTNAIRVRAAGCAEQLVRPGELFYLGDAPALAMDARLESIRERLAWCIGLTNHDAVDDAIEVVAEGRPVALVGPVGMDALPLAKAIHATRPGAGCFQLVASAPLPSPTEVDGSTIYVDLDAVRVTARFVRQVLTRRPGRRVIFAARDVRTLRFHLDTTSDRVRAISLTPLALRRAEIPDLLVAHWRAELPSKPAAACSKHLVAGLAQYDWPRNFDELRESARRVSVYLEHGSLRRAARELGITHQTLTSHLHRIGFWPGGTRHRRGRLA